MFEGDRRRKENLVQNGFRLPCALDNRPLTFAEFEERIPSAIHVSATPGPWEREKAGGVSAEQVIRPTGIVDPPVLVRPATGQVDDLLHEIRARAAKGERVLVTTLTKRMAEELTEHLAEVGVKVRWLHSDVTTLERAEILRDLRLGVFDVLVGINLLREGLDLPEVSLVAVLDADREGFLRSETSLVQVAGRAARNVNGVVLFYADRETGSLRRALDEMERRRTQQRAYNAEHGVTPSTIVRAVRDTVGAVYAERDYVDLTGLDALPEGEADDRKALLARRDAAERDMRRAAKEMRFEDAARFRDDVRRIEALLLKVGEERGTSSRADADGGEEGG
jgi:excinuclease ABC subunit B